MSKAFSKGKGVNGRASDYGLTSFIQAAIDNDVDTMKEIVSEYRSQPAKYYVVGKDHNRADTALIKAASLGNLEAVEYILQLAEDNKINNATEERSGSSTYNNETALFRAANNGHYDIVKALVNAGADVFAEVRDQLPVDFASKHGHNDIVEYLNGIMNDQRPLKRGGSRRRVRKHRTRKHKVRKHRTRKHKVRKNRTRKHKTH
jgi:ankyrin repeat protein